MKTFLFPGQGSQVKGMGGSLFDEFPDLTQQADDVLGYSIKELCLKDPRKELRQTQFTQPALYVVNALSYLKAIETSGQKPDFIMGHSLGEFNALFAAKCFDFIGGLELVKKRSELMSRASGGGMAAILNANQETIQTIFADNGLTNIDLANYNTPSQIVVSGLKEDIKKAQAFFEKGEMKYVHLNTSGAFHSRYMEPAKVEFEAYLKTFQFKDLKIPVISNVSAKPYQNDEILENLANQITSSVRWSESIQYLMALGEEQGTPMEFEEIGHGEVLTKMVRKIQEEAPKTVKPQVTVAAPATNHSITADEKVSQWNQKFPKGTRVKSIIVDDDQLETRTEAVVLFGHRAAVYMKGYNGYFDLDELSPR